MQDNSIIRETDQLLVAPLIFRYIAFRSRALHSQNWSASLRKTKLVRDPGAGFRWPAGSGLTLSPANWPSFHYTQRRGLREIGTALSRLCRETK